MLEVVEIIKDLSSHLIEMVESRFQHLTLFLEARALSHSISFHFIGLGAQETSQE